MHGKPGTTNEQHMKSAYLNFLKQLLIYTGIMGAVALAFTFLLPKTFFSPALPFLFCFFTATTLLSYYYLLQTVEKRFIKFVNAFLLTIIAKLALYMAVMIIYVFLNRRDAVPFMLGFFILYLCYTIFESVCIIRYTRPATDKTSPDNHKS